MNPIPIFAVFLVLGAAAIVNVSSLPNYGGSSWAVSPKDCSRSEVFSRCDGNPSCQKTCDNYNEPIPCTRSSGLEGNMCYPGCVCKPGFVRVAQGDQCIPLDKCEGRVKH
ncbi:chymotrypsin inhibitor Ani s 6-like [Neodiprion virginianus]|uniref:chymotrypsin inhibitor Ani s 6-like n=1 Tax=Neodiprion fabricii TaxID=2872261 RepID=UPI001ED90A4D|nr:chymotrypsin inhibitor Ani s 6-like [Neodiprion fabricii]XP_046605650.1 chymotrypsin inhibitor Ani s 6-like [Neodiprion virginianus]